MQRYFSHHLKYRNRSNLSSQSRRHSRSGSKLILGIETSCDDTCAAILNTNGQILSNVKSSQIKDVIELGGVMTVSIIRLHSMAMHGVILTALKEAKIKNFNELTAIAITVKPGQVTSLDIGLNYAKCLALEYKLPLIPIHHMEAHALTAMICDQEIRFPFLALLISGGHSQIVLFKSLSLIFLIGNSFDCGPGELIDKLARLLKIKNLGEPFNLQSGGESIEQLAKLIDLNNKKLKFSNLNRKQISNCNFNYGGMRTFYATMINRLREQNERFTLNTIKPNGFKSVDVDSPLDETCFICADLQFNLVNQFTNRLERAIKFIELTNILDDSVNEVTDIKLKGIDYANEPEIKLPLVVSGGVACNDTMMSLLSEKLKSISTFYNETRIKFCLPRPFYLCTDNATMIAWNGILKYLDNSSYLIQNEQEISEIRTEFDAKLGIDITHLIKRLVIR